MHREFEVRYHCCWVARCYDSAPTIVWNFEIHMFSIRGLPDSRVRLTRPHRGRRKWIVAYSRVGLPVPTETHGQRTVAGAWGNREKKRISVLHTSPKEFMPNHKANFLRTRTSAGEKRHVLHNILLFRGETIRVRSFVTSWLIFRCLRPSHQLPFASFS